MILGDGKSVSVILILAVSERVTDFVSCFLIASKAPAATFEGTRIAQGNGNLRQAACARNVYWTYIGVHCCS